MAQHPAFQSGDGVLLIDPQNDFCPGGALPVAEGDLVMPVLTEWAAAAERADVPVYVSRDWHPARTTHFEQFGGIWPAHCVIDTPGAAFHPALRLPSSAFVISKGMGETEDAYSAFQGRDNRGQLLDELLTRDHVEHLYVMGLATDYCVRSSALDGLERGLRVTLVPEGMRAVNLQADDGRQAEAAMRAAGAEISHS